MSLAPTTDNDQSPTQAPLPTFLDHVRELRRRLFWVVAVVLVVSAASYSILDQIIGVLMAPLGDKQLYYLTPAGGLTFAIKLCTFVGITAGVPVVMYQVYRFLEPLMGSKRKSALFHVGLSTLFAAAGVLFAYFVSLPAALHFLTNFNLGNIEAMLTVDAYLSFVITYLLGAALLFQIPLLLMIINTMTPLKPSKLMGLQKFVIVGAFILAAIISPTPDIMNQAFLAVPIIAMYQLGVMLVWLQQKMAARRGRSQIGVDKPIGVIPADVMQDLALPEPAQPAPQPVAVAAEVAEELAPAPAVVTPVATKPQPKPRFVSDIAPRGQASQPQIVLTRPPRWQPKPLPPSAMPTRTIDGFMRPAQPATS